jgi:acetate kinase
VDALVFSGGIGERSKELRVLIGKWMGCLGYTQADDKRNDAMDWTDGVVQVTWVL